MASLEISAWVNRLLADLAADVRSSGIAELADARSLPITLPRARRWWLPGVDGYGCLRSGSFHAPFLVAWDRAAAPDVHRRRRLAGWFAASAGVDRRWGRGGLPPVLVICRSAWERRVWEEALARRDEAGYGRIDLLFTIRKELHAAGAGDARWWRPGRAAAPLVELLGWGEAPVLDAARIARTLEGYRPPPRRTGAPPSRTARAWATGGEAQPVSRRLGDLALVTSPAEKTLIEWAARHPLLSAAELAALTDQSGELTSRRLERLTQLGAIGVDAVSRALPGSHEPQFRVLRVERSAIGGRAGDADCRGPRRYGGWSEDAGGSTRGGRRGCQEPLVHEGSSRRIVPTRSSPAIEGGDYADARALCRGYQVCIGEVQPVHVVELNGAMKECSVDHARGAEREGARSAPAT